MWKSPMLMRTPRLCNRFPARASASTRAFHTQPEHFAGSARRTTAVHPHSPAAKSAPNWCAPSPGQGCFAYKTCTSRLYISLAYLLRLRLA